jgi:hypothetical protein
MSDTTVFAATGVAIGGRALLIEGPPGSGKSTLAAKLIDRGATLIGDDAVSLSIENGVLVASPPPNIAGKLELRNVGLVDYPCTSAPVCLLLELSGDAPRFIDHATCRSLLERDIPALSFDPAIAASAIRAETAMALFGLPA